MVQNMQNLLAAALEPLLKRVVSHKFLKKIELLLTGIIIHKNQILFPILTLHID